MLLGVVAASWASAAAPRCCNDECGALVRGFRRDGPRRVGVAEAVDAGDTSRASAAAVTRSDGRRSRRVREEDDDDDDVLRCDAMVWMNGC